LKIGEDFNSKEKSFKRLCNKNN